MFRYNGVRLTWNAVGGAAGYAIYRSTNPYAKAPKWTKVGSTKAGVLTFTHKDGLKASKSGVYRQ